MKSVPFILACVAGGLAILYIIWPNQALIGTATLLCAVAIAVASRGI